ncbi:MAG: hypothetical protein ACTSVK_16340 [Promethearchaeota archaeon]
METSIERDLEKILLLCEEISKKSEEKLLLKSWIEKNIIKFCLTYFETNFEDSNNPKNLLISTFDDIFTIIKNSLKQTIYYIKFPSKDEINQIFFKFLSLLLGQKKIKNIFLISYSPLLIDEEICINVYNVAEIQKFVNFVNLTEIAEKSGLKIINAEKMSDYRNNSTFINPISIEIFQQLKFNSKIFDITVNSTINSENLIDLFKYLLKLEEYL